MGGPFNPNTLLPTSLQLNRIQQIRQLHPQQHQVLINREQDNEKKEKQQRVNSRDKTAKTRIQKESMDQRNNGSGRDAENRENEGNNEDNKQDIKFKKGHYLDIKV